MDCFKYERFLKKKPMRGYFNRCLPFIAGKKIICENVWISRKFVLKIAKS
jgi:hypothetical protein